MYMLKVTGNFGSVQKGRQTLNTCVKRNRNFLDLGMEWQKKEEKIESLALTA